MFENQKEILKVGGEVSQEEKGGEVPVRIGVIKQWSEKAMKPLSDSVEKKGGGNPQFRRSADKMIGKALES